MTAGAPAGRSGIDRRMRVAHASAIWLPRTQAWLYTLLSHLPATVESHVICEATRYLDEFPVSFLHPLSVRPPALVWLDRAIRKLGIRPYLGLLAAELRALAPDALHSHFGDVGWRNARLARALGCRHVVSFYGADATYLPALDGGWYARYRQLFRLADVVLCEGPHMRAHLEGMGCPPERLRVVHLGVAVEAIRYVPRAWDGLAPLRVLLAASFREKKGIPYAIAALGQLARRLELEVTIVGDADGEARSQAEKARILEAIGRAGLKERIRLLGYQPHRVLMDEAYRHHVFLAPSVLAADGDAEGGLPVVLIEMLASGIVVVGSRHCDIPELVRHGETGLLAEERDSASLLACLEWLVDHRHAWGSLTASGRRHVEAEFDAAVQGRRLAELYVQ